VAHRAPRRTGRLLPAGREQAESAVPSAVFRGQARMLATSAGLLVLVTGVAMVPSARTGALSGWLDILAALAAMAAGGLALPV